ncbi:MAG: hypothetical protein II811_04225, partial [Spirochaetaceae bacterium]|nr:hypothetical protein [Spirochaetaceae bacterium]
MEEDDAIRTDFLDFLSKTVKIRQDYAVPTCFLRESERIMLIFACGRRQSKTSAKVKKSGFLKKMCYNKNSMKSLKNKTKKISFRIGLTLGLEIVALLFVLILFIGGTMRKSLRDEYVNSAMALVRSGVKIMNQRNSRSTQQLRLYTLSDLALSNEFSTERVAEWLVQHRKLRYQDFQRLFYVDIETGMAYSDEGDVFSVKNTEYFTRIKEGNLSQYISNPVGTSAADAVFYVCKSINKNKK